MVDTRRRHARAIEAFADRTEAGRALADRLAPLVQEPCVVAAIPRGGVTVAMPVVERLAAPLTVIYARKLTSPLAPELAFGALDEDGESIVEADTVAALRLRPSDIEQARARVAAEIRRRMAFYRVPPLAHYLPDRAVVLVDDGLATGLTMRAAVAYARRHGARRIVVAVPCAAPEANAYFERVADRVVSLIVDPGFMAVGAYYIDFSPVTDEQVVAMLERATAARPADRAARSDLRVSFSTAGGFRLAGQLFLPATPGPHPVVAFAHGWGSGKDSPRNRAVAAALQAQGVASLLFDFTGHGESEGTAEQSTLAQQVSDLRAALDLLETLDDVDPGRIGIVGASSGAAVALGLAAEDPRVRALALRSANVEGAEAAAPRVTVPTLLVVGERDTAIRAMNEALMKHLGGECRLDVVPRGDHLFDDPETLRQATARMVEWLTGNLR